MSEQLLGNLSKGLLFILSAPAGTGKTTLVKMLEDEFSCVRKSISCTTRAPRPGELPGKDYNFLSEAAFEAKVQSGDFLEHAQVFEFFYGTSRADVLKEQAKGKHVILVIDTQGALQLKGTIPAIFIFVSPPSLEELRERLLKRKTESSAMIEKRLSWAQREIALAKEYDYHIINQNLHTAYQVLRSILIAEEHRVRKEETQCP